MSVGRDDAPDETGEGEGFARRWSRLKRQTRVAAPPPEPSGPMSAAPIPAAPVELPPAAETIPLEDITAWLSRTLPEGWREVALRRLWSADVGIRDFIGPADYAWDWNTPGGAPGWTAMRASDDIGRLLARAIGEPLPPQDRPLGPDGLAAEAPAEADAAIHEPDLSAPEPCPAEQPLPDRSLADSPEAVAIPPDEHDTPPPRRGGRATPI